VQFGTVDCSPMTTAPLSTLVPEMSVSSSRTSSGITSTSTPTPIAVPEVATSLQTKVIDSAESGINTLYHNKFYDIAKYVADVRHTHQCVALSWAKQDAATQKAIMDAAEYAEQWNRKFILDEDRDIQEQVKAKGVTITCPASSPTRRG
jgi:TRAP-type C4-dicarboxylate transport system substrate-binding protein